MSNVNHLKNRRLLRHLPPTAVPVQLGDVGSGLAALWQPQDAVERLRLALMARTGSQACHLLGSAREALTVILLGLKRLSTRTQVIVPAYGCPTVVQAVLEADLQPVLCDVSPRTLDLDRKALRSLIGEEVLAIVPTHLYGLAQDVRDLLEIGREYGIVVIEDAAQAFGATFQGRMVGTWGDAGLYSLGRSKCIPAGHGGALVCQEQYAAMISDTMQKAITGRANRDLASLALFTAYGLATHPVGWWFVARTPLNPADEGMDLGDLAPIHLRGISAVQAGIGASILERLDGIQATSRQNARQLMDRLAEFTFVRWPTIPAGAEPVFLRLPLVVEGEEVANRLFDRLWEAGIGVSRSYWRTLADLFSEELGTDEQDYPGAARLARCLLTLPTHTYLKQDDFARISRAFRTVDSQGG
ncbi:MAG: DegT/DnrJ/EryC1/StrS family aminotransferase [Anaerolineae bacterium]|jgi:dTDP-4-amino-4,6-dideoxygalactose transaminase